MKIEHQIIMLPSEKPSGLCKCNCPVHKGGLVFSEEKGSKDSVYEPQHLYILSDEEIKRGDWFVNLGSGGHPKVAIYQANSENSKAINEFNFPEIKKIIGTTNSELHLNKIVEEDMHMYKEPLPQISQDLIKSYVENPFDKVMVEYLTKLEKGTDLGNECNYIVPDKPKLNQDGTLAVTLVEKKMYSREEVEDMFRNAIGEIHSPDYDDTFENLSIWIKENL